MRARTTARAGRSVAQPFVEPTDRSMRYFELAVSTVALAAAIILFVVR
jgi:hypothetical protein